VPYWITAARLLPPGSKYHGLLNGPSRKWSLSSCATFSPSGRRSVSEGVYTAGALVRLAADHGIDAPISAAVDAVLRGASSIDDSILALLARPFRAEHG